MKRKANAPQIGTLPAPPMSEFMTRERANEGHRIQLFTPAGVATAHWLRVRGVDSDEFTRASNRSTRNAAALIAEKQGEEREAAILEETLGLLSSLVADWSFSDPALMGEAAKECTRENVVAFLRSAPQIAKEIDKFASDRRFFFTTPLESLAPMPKPSSS